ncbi:hypothetical protein [Marinicrinis sediminis]|uniref:ABC transporter permease n=1 Tax=Marinicrinis sediminis TaxID=1652465 RepID=A0ABW5RAM3_9BACL
MFKMELKRAVCNYRMLFVVILSLLLLYLSAYNTILSSSWFIDQKADDLSKESIEKLFEFGKNKYHIWTQSYLYMQSLFILIIILPYASSYVYEKQKGFHYFSMIRAGTRKYRMLKILSGSIAGGLALIVPELLYYLGLSLIARNQLLHPFQLMPAGLFSDLFQTHPDLYIILIIGIHFFLGVSYTAFAIGLTSFFSRTIYVYIIPFVFYLFYDIVISSTKSFAKYAITPVYNFMSSTGSHIYDHIMLFGVFIFFGLLLFYINYKWVLKHG